MRSVKIGKRNKLANDIVVNGFKGGNIDCRIGDDNAFHEGIRILADRFYIGNDCTIHRNVSFLSGKFNIGNNVWIGQGTCLDGLCGLSIGDGVTIGYNCFIWTHANRNNIPECHYHMITGEPVVIEKDVWLMGCNIVVNPGVRISEGVVVLSNSVVTKDLIVRGMYGGVPAKLIREL